MIIATALGLAAAFLFALSAFLQQRAARETVGGHTVSLREPSEVKTLARRLPRSRTWLRGWLANLAGWFSQAAALQVGSVAAVQPLMSTQLLFVLTMASAEQRRWPQRRDWLSALAVCGGLVRALASRFVMTRLIGVFPLFVQRWFARSVYGPAFVQAIVSNMPGPPALMTIVGVPLERVVPILPLAPGAPIALGALSWTGTLGIGLSTDPEFVDAHLLAAAMRKVLREMADADAVQKPRITARYSSS